MHIVLLYFQFSFGKQNCPDVFTLKMQCSASVNTGL